MKTLKTSQSCAGTAAGTAFVYVPAEKLPGDSMSGLSEEQATELFLKAEALAEEELSAAADEDGVFAAHLEMLRDPMIGDIVREGIFSGMSLPDALDKACKDICSLFSDIDDEYLKSRTDDVRDVISGIRKAAAKLSGEIPQENPFSGLPAGTVVFAEELFPSDTASMDFSKIAAIVTASGSSTGHVCIIARSRGIPALTGVKGCTEAVSAGDRVVVDGPGGTVLVNPDGRTLSFYGQRIAEEAAAAGKALTEASLPVFYPSGKRIPVCGNAASVEDVGRCLDAGADGVGLFRTEFLYMRGDTFPDEETQFRAYRAAAVACADRPLTIRTLDIGGDKPLPYMDMGKEDNPFLGWRGIRVSLDMPELFKVQLRAILRAGAFGNVRVMFPMIVSPGEFLRARALLEECAAELEAENADFDPEMKAGTMIETPSAVFVADSLASVSDFFSIGTNDLTQYIMAADRGNPKVSALLDPSFESVSKAVSMAVSAAHAAGIEAGICGEYASWPESTSVLLDLQIDEFSLNSCGIPSLKERIRNKFH